VFVADAKAAECLFGFFLANIRYRNLAIRESLNPIFSTISASKTLAR
jgi:hypothetical protein